MLKFWNDLKRFKTMEVTNNSYKEDYFDLLPDEMVIQVLSFVDADTLLDCKIVCKRWRELINAYVFQEKASRENEYVNNGLGYYSFSQIDSNTVRKLELPWYVFYVICKHDPFNRNLVKNNCGQNEFKHWDLLDYQNHWAIEQTPQGAPELPDEPDFDGYKCCFVTTFTLCSKSQKITFKDYGITDTMIKFLQPDILVSEWYSGRFDCGSRYGLRASVHDSSGKLTEQHNYNEFLPAEDRDVWNKASLLFKNQCSASHLILYHSGVDTQYWAGNYGAKISGSVVKVLLPVKLKCAEC